MRVQIFQDKTSSRKLNYVLHETSYLVDNIKCLEDMEISRGPVLGGARLAARSYVELFYKILVFSSDYEGL